MSLRHNRPRKPRMHYRDHAMGSYTACRIKLSFRIHSTTKTELLTCSKCIDRTAITDIKCWGCDATVPNTLDSMLGRHGWGWLMAPDIGLGEDAHGTIPGYFYACPECSWEEHLDAWSWARAPDEPMPEAVRIRHKQLKHKREQVDA